MSSQVITPDDEPVIIITRVFDAPQALVYRCYTDPAHMAHFWGPHGSTLPVCKVDLRVGGLWHYVMRFADGNEYPVTAAYTEISPPDRIVYRDAPDGWSGSLDQLPPINMHSTISFRTLEDGRCEVSVLVRLNDMAARDMTVKMGFALMVQVGGERLETYLKTL